MGLLEAIQVVPEWWLQYLFRTGVEGAFAAALLWGVFRFGKRISPSVLYACALLVLLKCTVPAFLISVPIPEFPVASSSNGIALPQETIAPVLTTASNPSLDAESVESSPPLVLDSQMEGENCDPIQSTIVNLSHPFRYRDGLIGIYLLGLGIMVLQVGRSAFHWRHIRKNSKRVADGALQAALQTTAQRFRLKTLPEIRVTSSCVSPVLHGVFRCTLLWPQSYPTTAETQEITLLHELAHWKRKDHWINALRVWIQCLHWWNPVVWWINRKITLYQEMCCDEVVLQHEANCHLDYLNLLVNLAEHSIEQRRILDAVGLSQAFYTLQERMKRIMDRTSRPTIALSLVGKIALVSVALLFLINFQPTESESQNPAPEKESIEPVRYPVYQLDYTFTITSQKNQNKRIILDQIKKQMNMVSPDTETIRLLEQSLQEQQDLNNQYSMMIVLDFDSPNPTNFPNFPGRFLTNDLPFTFDQIYKPKVNYLCNRWVIRENIAAPPFCTAINTVQMHADLDPIQISNCRLLDSFLKSYVLACYGKEEKERDFFSQRKLPYQAYYHNPGDGSLGIEEKLPTPEIEESSSKYQIHFPQFQGREISVEFDKLPNDTLILTRYSYHDNKSEYELRLDLWKERVDLTPGDVWSWNIAGLEPQ